MADRAAWARYYHDRLRWAVVPIAAGTKHPRTAWQEDCRRARPLPALLAACRPGDGLGIVQGPHSCVALDLDGPDAWTWITAAFPHVPWDAVPTVRTGSGGRHVYWPFPDAWRPLVTRGVARVTLWAGPGHQEVSVHLARSLTVAPPSIHPNGTPYVWDTPPVAPLAPLTDPALLAAVVQAAHTPATPPTLRRATVPYPAPDRLLRWLAARGIVPTGSRRAADRWVYYVPCPWAATHSIPDDGTATAVFWSPVTVGFRCLHAHCRDRRWTHLAQIPVQQSPERAVPLISTRRSPRSFGHGGRDGPRD